MADLITLSEYKQFDTTTPSSDDTLLGYMISAASEAIVLYCNRTFTATDYDEVFDGTGYRTHLVYQFPLISVSRIATGVTAVMTVQNTATAASRATVRVTSTGLSLYSVASGSATTTAITFASATTLTALASAVSLVSGWTASVQGDYGTWASADLKAQQGAMNAKQAASLVIHTQDIQEFSVYAEEGEIDNPFGFTKGFQNWRIAYRAGFESIPEAIKQAAKEVVKATYSSRKLDPNLTSESLGVWSWTKAATQGVDNLSLTSKAALNYYRVIRVGKFKAVGGTWR